MPAYDVAERHHVRIAAPAAVTFQAASEMYLEQCTIVRAIFKTREWIMRSHAARKPEVRAFLDQMRAIGWGVLAEVPGREIVMGAVTRPWMADVVFRPLSPDQFAAFAEPDYVKIAWTLRADPIGAAASIFRTETGPPGTSSGDIGRSPRPASSSFGGRRFDRCERRRSAAVGRRQFRQRPSPHQDNTGVSA
jgi:hypothetical protein